MHNSQHAYRPKRSTLTALKEVLNFIKGNNHKPVHLLSIDLEKAFDRVTRAEVELIVHQLSCEPDVKCLILAAFVNLRAYVDLHGEASRPFPYKVGLKQGDELSALIFQTLKPEPKDFWTRSARQQPEATASPLPTATTNWREIQTWTD